MHRNPRTSVVAASATLALLLLLPGCGQKGPLVLPAPKAGASAPAR